MTSHRLPRSFAYGFLTLMALVPLSLGGCEGDGGGGGDDGCELEGVTYQPGESVPSLDGCNACECTEGGQIACTDMACVNECEYEGAVYQPGESFPASDGCNTCTCDELGSGQVGCTEIACVTTCEYEGAVYQVGESFPAGDGCNTCSCMEDGQVACTLIACLSCIYAGEPYAPGDTFPALDGCNTCSCQEDGSISCTEIACACNPPSEWWREYTSESVEECGLLDFECQTNTTRFDNACGCGCEQSTACPQYFDCMPPNECDIEAIQAECPFSEIVL